MAGNWTLDDGRRMQLVTLEDFKALPKGTVLLDIFGKPHTKGVDYIDDDTRGGYLAFGLLADSEEIH